MTDLIEDPGPILDPGGPGGKPEIDRPEQGIGSENVKIKYVSTDELYEQFEENDLLDTDAGRLLQVLADQEIEGTARVMPGANVQAGGDGDPGVFLKYDGIEGAPLEELARSGAFDEIDGFVFEPPGKAAAPEDVQIKLPLFHKVEYTPRDDLNDGAWRDIADHGSEPILPEGGFDEIIG